MRIRVRGPAGQSTISLDNDATVDVLRRQITNSTGLSHYEVKYGYPQIRPLNLESFPASKRLSDLGLTLNGEQLIITRKDGGILPETSQEQRESTTRQEILRDPFVEKVSNQGPDDPPEIPSPEHHGTFVLRIMPDDNSCLFRAISSATMGGVDVMTELRSVVAQTIQANPGLYTEAVLEKKPDDYCQWIQNEDAWGGGIELSILSKHFDIEICSIDVQSLRVDRFNEGSPMRCIVVYSGIHYDTIALSPSNPPYTHTDVPAEFDTKMFDANDPFVLEKSLALCKVLQERHYYTDTAGFRLRCNTCGRTFVGEKGATQHAEQTGHVDFGEAN
ncbi:ubiquitin-specific protease OTU1 [Aspergillus saccharolyticus JOP 1030-1]|uniref:Ubiquitin thioesterase OTU n=1 Tax=Aspergillus saccharolyticus JOP 1030-1 TaxID=1450539 RepID=A0A318Z250_9EURO|nr:putative OTU-like cysteine protease [Aspergillus saccharolyticus JOP 1030-1]PYH41136.1 putative OTU-like cysteine protease [Aspergillus saccharolyticus JOP 1030-1]